MLLAKILSKNYKIGALLAYLLLIVNKKNLSITSGLILKLDMLSFRLLITILISSFIISWTHSIVNILKVLSLFNIF